MLEHDRTEQSDRLSDLRGQLLKGVSRAERRYHLFADRDRILVAVSGGKDSLTMLDLLHRRRQTRETYLLVAAHIRSDHSCGRTVPYDWLKAWCDKREIPLVSDEIAVAEELRSMSRARCFRCAWQRRKALFEMAERLQCNKLALGHHMDDFAETVLLNLLYCSRVEGFEPKARFFGGKLWVIRPLVSLAEADIARYARASRFPIEGRQCPYGRDSRRAFAKRVLCEAAVEGPDVRLSVYRAVADYQTKLSWAEASLDRDVDAEVISHEED